MIIKDEIDMMIIEDDHIQEKETDIEEEEIVILENLLETIDLTEEIPETEIEIETDIIEDIEIPDHKPLFKNFNN